MSPSGRPGLAASVMAAIASRVTSNMRRWAGFGFPMRPFASDTRSSADSLRRIRGLAGPPDRAGESGRAADEQGAISRAEHWSGWWRIATAGQDRHGSGRSDDPSNAPGLASASIATSDWSATRRHGAHTQSLPAILRVAAPSRGGSASTSCTSRRAVCGRVRTCRPLDRRIGFRFRRGHPASLFSSRICFSSMEGSPPPGRTRGAHPRSSRCGAPAPNRAAGVSRLIRPVARREHRALEEDETARVEPGQVVEALLRKQHDRVEPVRSKAFRAAAIRCANSRARSARPWFRSLLAGWAEPIYSDRTSDS